MEGSLKELAEYRLFYKRIFKNGNSGQRTGGNHKRQFSLQRKIGL